MRPKNGPSTPNSQLIPKQFPDKFPKMGCTILHPHQKPNETPEEPKNIKKQQGPKHRKKNPAPNKKTHTHKIPVCLFKLCGCPQLPVQKHSVFSRDVLQASRP